jgi:hypothetical protein
MGELLTMKYLQIIFWTCVVLVLMVMVLIGIQFIPETHCLTRWKDSNGENIEGPDDQCSAKLEEKSVGSFNVAYIGGQVYFVRREKTTEPAGFPCMTGGACLPFPNGRQTWNSITFTRLDGPVDFEKLRAYIEDIYFGDGTNNYYFTDRLETLSPALDVIGLRSFACRCIYVDFPCRGYVTDGHYVLKDGKVLHSADPSTFANDVPMLKSSGSSDNRMNFSRDAKHVFHGSDLVVGADPGSFGVIDFTSDDEHSKMFGRVIASDRSKAWQVDGDENRRLALEAREFAKLRSHLAEAIAANAYLVRVAGAKRNNDEQVCMKDQE